MKTYFCSGCYICLTFDGVRQTAWCTSLNRMMPLIAAKRTKWFNALKNPPVREGWYEIKNIGCECAYWYSVGFRRNGKPFRFPSEIMWRGLTPNE